jgi:hypothetical protein
VSTFVPNWTGGGYGFYVTAEAPVVQAVSESEDESSVQVLVKNNGRPRGNDGATESSVTSFQFVYRRCLKMRRSQSSGNMVKIIRKIIVIQ